jgi:NAD(P)-dependent dehydrogenase (short-subunit alcohol dehydrogenase family)
VRPRAMTGVVWLTSSLTSRGNCRRCLLRLRADNRQLINALQRRLPLSKPKIKNYGSEAAKLMEINTRVLKRAEYPEDLVGTAIYLASTDSDFMTGQALVVDGGNVMH